MKNALHFIFTRKIKYDFVLIFCLSLPLYTLTNDLLPDMIMSSIYYYIITPNNTKILEILFANISVIIKLFCENQAICLSNWNKRRKEGKKQYNSSKSHT